VGAWSTAGFQSRPPTRRRWASRVAAASATVRSAQIGHDRACSAVGWSAYESPAFLMITTAAIRANRMWATGSPRALRKVCTVSSDTRQAGPRPLPSEGTEQAPSTLAARISTEEIAFSDRIGHKDADFAFPPGCHGQHPSLATRMDLVAGGSGRVDNRARRSLLSPDWRLEHARWQMADSG
jgi:hypothetical protein